MTFSPRYPHPFTLAQAIALDVSIITEEISRLQNSLKHLKETQRTLDECIVTDPDPEFVKALEENKNVIRSQEERIFLLKLALTEKGIHAGAHYDVHNPNVVTSTPLRRDSTRTNRDGSLVDAPEHSNGDEGVHL